MKTILLIFIFSLPVMAQKNPEVGSPSNNVSRGQSDQAGISESPTGTTAEEQEDYPRRAGSMGGAPNIGAGMGTGTGAGSKVGNDLDEGTITAGSLDGDDED